MSEFSVHLERTELKETFSFAKYFGSGVIVCITSQLSYS